MALINDFMSLIYPRYCEACGQNLYGHETYLCNSCLLTLPKSNYHRHERTELELTFAGRVPLQAAMSFYIYQKCGRVQKLLHAIKYQNQKELGEFIGRLYAQDLSASKTIDDIDVVIPIPLHKAKLRARGYNQSEWFAKGLAAGISKPLQPTLLERAVETSTQTKKKKYQRWENVEGIFRLPEPDRLFGRHVLLVDDVITTGATIEAAWMALKSVGHIRVSVASIAFASTTN